MTSQEMLAILTDQNINTKKREGPWDSKTKSFKELEYIDVPEVFAILNKCFGMDWDLFVSDPVIHEVQNIEPVGETEETNDYGKKYMKKVYGPVNRKMWTVKVTIVFDVNGRERRREGLGSAIICKSGISSEDAIKNATTEAVKIAGKHMNIGLFLYNKDRYITKDKKDDSPQDLTPQSASSIEEKRKQALALKRAS